MSDIAVSVRGLSKRYLLYRGSPYRLMDFLGIRMGRTARAAEEYWALQDLSFDIVSGSTVGIIGRNGAGKSTLLRLLGGASTPTRGELVVRGRVSALLELGTGFHPDLTGHENIFASGLYLGIERMRMQALYEEIVEFAEIGPFIHQPVRTYSTGMYMRLAFAVATSVPTDVQVIDEVLGVGDMYFFGKCLERFRRFQEEGRTTILVSHDHQTILRLCTRCLWLDRGRIMADGEPLKVVMAYTESILEEQDRRATDGRTVSGVDLGRSKSLRAEGALRIDRVEFLRGDTALPADVFSLGESMIVRIHYHATVRLPQAVVSVTVYRIDGMVIVNAISSLDGVELDLAAGQGSVDVAFEKLLLGPGEYTVAVGIYPELDLGDPISPQHVALWHLPQSFSVRQPVDLAMNLGVVMHPVRWRIAARPEVSAPAAQDTRPC